MASTKQDQELGAMLVDHINDEFAPDDVFDDSKLKDWANNNIESLDMQTMIDHVVEKNNVDYVYEKSVLEDWARSNGFVKQE